MKKCKKCKTVNDDSAKFCRKCGEPMAEESKGNTVLSITLMVIWFAAIIACGAYGMPFYVSFAIGIVLLGILGWVYSLFEK